MPEMQTQTMQTQIQASILKAIEAQGRVLAVLNENLRLLEMLSQENWGLEVLKRDLAKTLEDDDGEEEEAEDRATNEAHA